MQEPVYVLHLITCHGRIMPRLAELLLFYFTTMNELWVNRAMRFHVNMSQLPLWTQFLSIKSFAFFKSFYPH